MKTLQNFLSAAGLSFLLCISAITARAQDAAASYWPFKEGNTWTINTKIEDKTLIEILTVTKVTQQGTSSDATVEYKIDDKVIQTEVYRSDDKGISRVSSGAGILNPPFPVVQYPMAADKKWKWTGTVNAGGKEFHGDSEISTSGPETLKLPAGEFKAIRVHSELTLTLEDGKKVAFPNDYWFAPGVGLVQQKAKLGNLDIFGELTSYKLK